MSHDPYEALFRRFELNWSSDAIRFQCKVKQSPFFISTLSRRRAENFLESRKTAEKTRFSQKTAEIYLSINRRKNIGL